MCTVSFVPANEKLIFSFNRDEQPSRQTPDYLSVHDVGLKKIFFAKDIKA